MFLLFLFAFIALFFSFLCSVCEATLLSMSEGYIESETQGDSKKAKQLKLLTDNIDSPLSAILTLNTIAHTVGAVGVGAQSNHVFGEAWMGVTSAVLTLLVLILSEIIPKTLGATHWRSLARYVVPTTHYLVFLLTPFVWLSKKITQGMSVSHHDQKSARQELKAMAQSGRDKGVLDQQEAAILTNLFNLENVSIRQIMTHRKKVFAVSETLTVEQYFHRHQQQTFSRIPIYEDDNPEHINGYVLKADLLLAQARHNNKPLAKYKREMVTVLSSMKLAVALKHFISKRAKLMLVVDEYGGLEGVLTLEDVIENLIGADLLDERDTQ